MTGNWLRTVLLALCTLLISTQALPCNTYIAAVSLGNTNSLSLRTLQQQATAGAGLSCPGVLTLLSAAYVRVTLNSTSPLVLSDGNGNQVPFRIYQDTGFAQPLLSGQPQQLGNVSLLTLGATSSAIALYFRTDLGPNVPAGTYTASVVLRRDWAICTIGAINLCSWARSPGVTQTCPLGICGAPTNWGSGSLATVNITLVVTKACLINSAPAVNFGAHALISQFTAQTQSVSVTCTNTEGFTISFDNGQNFSSPWRRMANSGQYLRYHLYRPNGTTVWNAATPLSAAGTGNAQSFTYQAIIDPGQPNAPAGTYIDNVLLIINY